jgi:hypothetical protein
VLTPATPVTPVVSSLAASRARVCLVAAPLMARSGVYRSALDLVAEARSRGLDWSAVIGLRPTAAGTSTPTDGVREVEVSGRGLGVVDEVGQLMLDSAAVRDADVVVTLVTQSDVAAARLGARLGGAWVAWVRGLPWPAPGEQTALRRRVIEMVESRALRSATDVWATTSVLAAAVEIARRPEIVPAGIPAGPRLSRGEASGRLVWAARLDVDKRPRAFADLVAATGVPGTMFGHGPLEADLRTDAPAGLSLGGWADPAALWTDAAVFVGTASREAFGRSAVEAALAGVPVVLGDAYGAAPLLVTDDELRRRFVLPVDDPRPWATAVHDLVGDAELRRRLSDHVHANASALTIGRSVDAVLARLAQLGLVGQGAS